MADRLDLDRLRVRPRLDSDEVPEAGSPWDDWGFDERVGEVAVERFVVEVSQDDGSYAIVGDMSWHIVGYGPNRGSRALNIGISLAPNARGRGIGATAQRQLAEHAFATTDIERVEASTDVENVAEQRALEKAGFVREGVLRSAQARIDGRHDLYVYSILRAEVEARPRT